MLLPFFHATIKGGEYRPMFKRFLNFIRGVWHRVIPYRQIEAVERIETPLTDDMVNALAPFFHCRCPGLQALSP